MKPKALKGLGASDLIEFIHEWGHPEWVVLAVEAPIEEVSSLYASMRSAKKRLSEVPIRVAGKQDDEIASLVAVVQPTNSSWSVILRSLCLPIEEGDIKMAQKDAQTLSSKLKTRAVAFVGEDTSGAMQYWLYQGGKQAGGKEWESQDDSADKAFAALGLYLPPCYPRRDAKTTWLAAIGTATERIQRADIIDLGEE